MAEPYLGEIRMFAGSFAPDKWVFCNGQLLSIGQYEALFSLLGTRYGGDGRVTFSVPDLRGRIPIGYGRSNHSAYDYALGENVGVENVSLTTAHMPSHTHGVNANETTGTEGTLVHGYFGPNAGAPATVYTYIEPINNQNIVPMHPNVLSQTGNGQPINNMQPYTCINFIIALQGVFPPRS